MIEKLVPGAVAAPLLALILSGCVSQQAYNEQAAQLEQARAQAAAEQAEIAKMQTENRWVMDATCCFRKAAFPDPTPPTRIDDRSRPR